MTDWQNEAFRWYRGKDWCIEEANIDGGPLAFIRYPPPLVKTDDWPASLSQIADLEIDDAYYPPLALPGLFEDFAELGQLVHQGGPRVDEGGPRVDEESLQLRLAAAANAPDARRAILEFVNRYGLPTYAEDDERTGGQGVALDDLLSWAFDLWWTAHRSYQLQRIREESDGLLDCPAEILLELEISFMLTQHLRGVRLVALPGCVTKTCGDLLDAMWLQLTERHYGSDPWAVCKGCGRLFSRGRKDQQYHDSACRSRAGTRRGRGQP